MPEVFRRNLQDFNIELSILYLLITVLNFIFLSIRFSMSQATAFGDGSTDDMVDTNFDYYCTRCNLKPKIGFIGGGNMAKALISGFLSAGITSSENMLASDPSEEAHAALAKLNVKCTNSNFELVDGSRNGIVVLAIKPSIVPELFRDRQVPSVGPRLLISICAGVTIEKLEKQFSAFWPSLPIVRVMPNTPALVGCGASAFSLGKHATVDHGRVVQCLLNTVGTSDQVPEYLMDAVTGLSGSGPAYVYTMIDALSDGGVKVGLPRDLATKLAIQTVRGSAEMILKTGKHPAEMKNMVCSPGGTTIAGVHVLEENRVRAAFMSAVEAATKRSKELGNH